ncbi:MAG: cytochrome P450 [Solirubrobacterales bacterium]|nr:cytochrome P450 [Solirubrobacterales bacterium]
MAVESPTKPQPEAAPSAPVIDGLPPGVRMPQSIQSLGFLVRNIPMMRRAHRKYGEMFSIKLLGFPDFVIISDPDLIKQTLTADAKLLHAGTGSPLGAVLGANSLLAIDEDIHLRQRRILLPPFHGERMQSYAGAFAEIADEEMDTWKTGEPMRTIEPMQRITLRAILKTIFGAHDESLTQLEDLVPQTVDVATKVVLLRFAQKDLGPRSPWGKFLRLRDAVDEVLYGLMEEARHDPKLAERTDVMSLLVQATHEDGTPMSDEEVRDQLMTMMIAGHETTASTLSWAVERLSRSPEVLGKLTESVRAGEADYLNVVFDETLRIRPTVSLAVRSVQKQPYVLNGYRLPVDTRIGCNPALTHFDPNLFKDPLEFRPERFLEERPSNYAYIPFGGGVRRCIGAAFARMEFNAVMERMLDRFDLAPTDEKFEPWGFRSVTFAPGNGGVGTFTPRR